MSTRFCIVNKLTRKKLVSVNNPFFIKQNRLLHCRKVYAQATYKNALMHLYSYALIFSDYKIKKKFLGQSKRS